MNKQPQRVTMLELDVALASNEELKSMLNQLLNNGYTADAVEKVITEMTRRGMTRLSQGVGK